MNYLIFSQNHWNSPLKYQRHRLTEYLDARQETQRIWYFSKVPMRGMEWSDLYRFGGRLFSTGRDDGGGVRDIARPVPSKVRLCRPFLYDGLGVSGLTEIFNRLFLRRIADMQLDWRSTIVISYQPIRALIDLKKRFNPFRMVYVSVHDFEAMPGVSRRVCEVERRLIEAADLFATDSVALAEKLKGNARADHLAPGCAGEAISLSRMKGFHAKKPRRLLYFGTVASYLDWTLIEGLLASGIGIDFIGRNHDVPEAYLRRYPGLSMLPPRDFERAVPTLLEYEGVILPYRVDERNDLIMPAKIYEMMSLGLPIFVPAMKWSMQLDLAGVLYQYSSLVDLLTAIHGFSLADFIPRRERMLSLAMENTWDARFDHFIRKVIEIEKSE